MGKHGPSLGGKKLDEEEEASLLLSALRNKVTTKTALDYIEETLPYVRKIFMFSFIVNAADVVVAMAIFKAPPKGESYNVASSVEDTLILSLCSGCLLLATHLFSVFTYWESIRNQYLKPHVILLVLSNVVYWYEVGRLILLLGKSVSYHWKDKENEAGVGLLLMGVMFTVAQLLIFKKQCALETNLWETFAFLQKKRLAELGDLEADKEKPTPPEALLAMVRQEEDDAGKPPAELSLLLLMKVLQPYFWPLGVLNKARCFATYFLLASAKTCTLISPIFIGRAVQCLSERKPVADVYHNVAVYISLVLSAKVMAELQSLVYLSVKQNAFAEIARNAFMHLHSLGLEWHLKKKLGSTLRAMDRGIQAADTVMTYLFLYLVPSFFELLATMVVFKLHFNIPSLSSAAFVCFALYTLVTVQLTLWRKRFREGTNKHDNDFHDKATDSLVNYETVKYFTAEEFETERYYASVKNYQRFSTAVQASLSLLNVSQQSVLQSCNLLCLCISAHHVTKGEMEVGAFVSVQVYVMNLFAPLSFLGTIYNAIIQALTDMTNFSQLLAELPSVEDEPNARDFKPELPPSIAFENVFFKYPTQATGLRGVSFFVPGGSETAICGQTGSGKSTIFRLLFRFYDVQSGAVKVDGTDVREMTQRSLRELISVVPQDTTLFNDTILYNVQYGKRGASMEEVERACRKAQILDKIEALPNKWATLVGERGLKLSTGEKQRVTIARCFLKNSKILVLDEWSSALDVQTEKSVHAAIQDLSSARTVLIIAHRLSTIRRSRQILVLEGGEILEKGSHEELLKKDGRYAQLYRTQAEVEEEEQ